MILTYKSFLPKRDMEWFFFCPRDRKYPNGSRTNRATKTGYWKATGKDRNIECQSTPFTVKGCRKTLVFYRGRAPLGDRTEWIMHEYRLNNDSDHSSPSFQGGFALCRVMKKNEKVKSSQEEQKGKVAGSSCTGGNKEASMKTFGDVSSQSSPNTSCPYHVASTMAEPEQASSLESINPSHFYVSPDLILDSSKDYPQVQDAMSGYFPQYDLSCSMNPWQSFLPTENSTSSSYSNVNGEIEFAEDLDQVGYFYRNEDVSHEGFDHINSLRYPKPF
ncbi:NAC domain-containing protein 71-like isoform X2 [Prosopis cineraria]|uniref:NAC domain-containing protein 71-like isoform X2 n=1 Tax=Prosopis cineraria TaxID=364024 RepID=UPI002410A7D8|nr:NAC domain-containing protein 71-like isoform X2 [Prosopis cineraria]